MCFQGPVFLRVQAYPCSRQESRALSFSEEKTHWQLPMNDVNIICDVTTKDGMSPTLTMLTGLARFVSMFKKKKRKKRVGVCMKYSQNEKSTISIKDRQQSVRELDTHRNRY